MVTFFKLLLGYMRDCFRSHERLKAEILILRHQLNILHRKAPKRLRLSRGDRALFVWLYRRFPDIGNATAIVRPETIIRWHRMGFRAWWRWKSHNPGGRPGIDQEPRDLVRRMCKENPLWGAPRIHGELLKLGFNVAQSTVSKYMLKRARSTVSRMEDFSPQPRRRHCIRGFPHRSDAGIRTTVRVCHLGARTPSPSMDRRHDQSDGGMAGPPDYRSLSLGHCSGLYHP